MFSLLLILLCAVLFSDCQLQYIPITPKPLYFRTTSNVDQLRNSNSILFKDDPNQDYSAVNEPNDQSFAFPVTSSKVFDEIIQFIKQIAAKNMEEENRYNLPTYKSSADLFEFGYKGKGQQFFHTTGVITSDTDFLRVPLLYHPVCHQLTYVRVFITRGNEEPPVVHLDVDTKEVIVGFPRRYLSPEPTKTTYTIDAYSEEIPYCGPDTPPMG